MLPYYMGKYKKENNLIDINEAVKMIKLIKEEQEFEGKPCLKLEKRCKEDVI